MTKKYADFFTSDTGRVEALMQVYDSLPGTMDYAILGITGNNSDQETITIGEDTYELHKITTDTAQDLSTELNNVNGGEHVLGIPGSSVLGIGAVLRAQSEYLRVVQVDKNSVRVERGAYGSTIATHADGTSLYEAAQAVGAGRLAIPFHTANFALAQRALFKQAVDWMKGKRWVRSPINVLDIASGAIIFTEPGLGMSASETLTNGTITADFIDGYRNATRTVLIWTKTITADDVTAGQVAFVAPFDVSEAVVDLYRSGRNRDDYNGAITVSGSRYVVTDNTGSNDFAADDIIKITCLS